MMEPVTAPAAVNFEVVHTPGFPKREAHGKSSQI